MSLPNFFRRRDSGLPKPWAVVVLFAGLLLALLFALLIPATAASAHDVVEITSPADKATVAAVPTQVTLTIDKAPATIGSKIEIKDASGADWAQGAVTVLDRVASQAVKPGAPAGQYTVNWRLVSSDGHPIEGTFSFSATAGENGASADGASSDGASAMETLGTAAVDTASTTAASQTPVSSGGGFPWLIVIVGVVAVFLIAGLLVFARRKLSRGGEEE